MNDNAGWFCGGRADCEACNHEWLAVWPLGADKLECPNCRSNKTSRYTRTAFHSEDEDE